MELAGCEAVEEALRGCRVVLLAATEAEAGPLREALRGEQNHTVATKAVHVGLMQHAPAVGTGSPLGVSTRSVVGVSGCDKANTAHLLTCILQAMAPAPRLVLQVGIAGGFAGYAADGVKISGPEVRVGDVVIATREAYADTGSTSPEGWIPAAELGLPIAFLNGAESGGVFPLDLALAEAAREAILETCLSVDGEGAGGRKAAGAGPRVLLGPCVTSSCATGCAADGRKTAGRWGALAESMEGAAAAHIAALYDVPFLEIRGISNLVTDRQRESWEVDRAIETAAGAALAVVAALERLPLRGE